MPDTCPNCGHDLAASEQLEHARLLANLPDGVVVSEMEARVNSTPRRLRNLIEARMALLQRQKTPPGLSLSDERVPRQVDSSDG